jgi:hypothetical protein
MKMELHEKANGGVGNGLAGNIPHNHHHIAQSQSVQLHDPSSIIGNSNHSSKVNSNFKLALSNPS